MENCTIHHQKQTTVAERIFTSGEHGVLSKFNIAKTIYVGPFKNEQVEDMLKRSYRYTGRKVYISYTFP